MDHKSELLRPLFWWGVALYVSALLLLAVFFRGHFHSADDAHLPFLVGYGFTTAGLGSLLRWRVGWSRADGLDLLSSEVETLGKELRNDRRKMDALLEGLYALVDPLDELLAHSNSVATEDTENTEELTA